MNISLIRLAVLLFGGLSLGGLYFVGLWLSLRHLPRWRRPLLSMWLSLLGRLAVLLGGGALLLHQAIAPPLQAILLMSVGVWLSRNLLIARLIASIERSPAAARHTVDS